MRQDWISLDTKVKLLEWRGRYDLLNYVSRGCPPLLREEIKRYAPKHPEHGWDELFARARAFPDDGHECKLIRAIASAAEVSRPFEGRGRLMLEGEAFLQAAQMGECAVHSI